MSVWVDHSLALAQVPELVEVTGTNDNVKLPQCRFCGEKKSHEELLDLNKDKATLHEYIQKLEYLKIDYVDLTNRLLPKTTCEYCYDRFHKAYEFFKKVKQAQIDLHVLFNAKINLKIEENENFLNPAEEEALGEYEETNAPIAKSTEPESFKNKNEESLSNENSEVLTAQNFLAGPSRAETVTPKQISLNNFIFICELTKTEKTFKNIDHTVNLKEQSNSQNNTTYITEFMKKIKTETDLGNDGSTCNIALDTHTFEKTNAHIGKTDNDCKDPTVICKTESLKDKKEDYFDPLIQGYFSAGSSRAQSIVTQKQVENEAVPTYAVNLDYTPQTSASNKIKQQNTKMVSKDTTKNKISKALNKSKKNCTKVIVDNTIASQEVPFVMTKKPDKQTTILQVDKLTPILIKDKNGNVSIKLCDQSTRRDGITSVQNNATHITKSKTEMDLMNKDVTTIDIEVNLDNTTSTSISNNFKEIISEPVEDLAIQSKNSFIHDLNIYSEFISWEFYSWFCLHCKEKFNNMNELRNHSKYVHNICFGFKCADCPERFRSFNPFVEHVREEHYDSLRLYCQYCNCEFKSAEQCITHTFSHWRGTTICEFCGEILPNFEALDRHKKAFRKVARASISVRLVPKILCFTGSWDDYDWSCQDCWMRMPDASTVRTHVQDVHKKCFSMRCVDCLLVVQDYVQFVNHVRKHRPYLDNCCQFCNMYIEEKRKLADHVNEHRHICHTCGHVFADNTELLQHIEQYNVRKVKGVPRAVSTKTTCDTCQKTYSSPYRLKLHLNKMHRKKRRRDFICQTCGKGYDSNSALQSHTSTHNDKTEKCKLCGKMFKSKYKLIAHANTHLEERQKFICDICGQSFTAKYGIQNHILRRHEIPKKSFRCIVCDKTFNTKSQLRNHERQHTGARPYSCEVCKRTFTCWGNCNKHMIRKHGVTLARTKRTARGKLDINSETGEAKNLVLDEDAEEWLKDLTRPRRKNRLC